ncbi:MAG: aspartate/glutamate racemase family protein [Comamonadaceae bacterium]|nr:aspartate/glutamate racemase family protein [Comamonadaceae bacterium]
MIACFGDPGLDAAREATARPVLGIAEAAFHAAAMLATGFSVVTTMTRTCVHRRAAGAALRLRRPSAAASTAPTSRCWTWKACGPETRGPDRGRGARRAGARPQRRHRAGLRRDGGAVRARCSSAWACR